MIVMLDNYDSFTYNLVQYMQMMGADVKVVRNNDVSVQDVKSMNPAGIVISPGPCRPETAGISVSLIQAFTGTVPILGVCLGHQAIAVAFGGKVMHARQLMHGKVSTVTADGKSLYNGVNSPFQAMRYHSLAVSRDGFPGCLEVTALAEDGEIMGIRHRDHPTEGIQFHPESIMTPVGKRLLRNFLKRTSNGESRS
jgi:anthranilate synthase component II